MGNRRVVITGLGTVNPLAWDVETFWSRLVAGENGGVPITRFVADDFTSRIGGQVSLAWPGVPEKYVDKREQKRFDRFAAFAVAASIEAVENSGINFDQCDRDRCGVVIGSGIGGLEELEQQHERMMGKGAGRVSPFTVPKLMVNAAAGNVSILFGLRGPSSSVATACASAANALGDAYRLIQRDFTDVVVSGGSEAALTRLGLSSFCALHALTTRNDDPQHASRPFDRNRDGFLLGEGAGVLVLEELEHAKKRGANIMGEIIGYGMTCDASHITAPDPEGRGACGAMRQALRDAGITPEQVDYINAHGTSTQLNDAAETKATEVAGALAAERERQAARAADKRQRQDTRATAKQTRQDARAAAKQTRREAAAKKRIGAPVAKR